MSSARKQSAAAMAREVGPDTMSPFRPSTSCIYMAEHRSTSLDRRDESAVKAVKLYEICKMSVTSGRDMGSALFFSNAYYQAVCKASLAMARFLRHLFEVLENCRSRLRARLPAIIDQSLRSSGVAFSKYVAERPHRRLWHHIQIICRSEVVRHIWYEHY